MPVRACDALEQVVVEFLFWDPSGDPRYCGTCPSWVALYNDFLAKNETMTRVWSDYGEQAVFKWIDITTADGLEKKQAYNVTTPNSVVINGKLRIEGEFTEPDVRNAVASALNNNISGQPTPKLVYVLALALTFGFLETFSPCLIILLSFVLSYTLGETAKFRGNLLRILSFGVGFIIAALFIGILFGALFTSLQNYQVILTWIICIFAFVFGFTLLGLVEIPVETKPLLQRLTRQRYHTYGGLIFLGFLFYFLDPCIAPIFVAMLPVLSSEAWSMILLFFSLGAILPFLFVGVVSGSISRLVRTTYQHKSRIRAISGLILIAYAAYIVVLHLV